MNYNETFFNCTSEDMCEQQIGYTKKNLGRITYIVISSFGVLSNFIFIIYNLVKKIKGKNRRASMKRFFLIFPFTDFLTSIYWLLSSVKFYKLKQIKENPEMCSIISVIYIGVISLQSTLINILIFHFKSINENPIEAILKPNKKIFIYIIICLIFGGLASGLSLQLQIVGRSSMNTCFINTEYSGWAGFIFLIPVILIFFAIVQLIHDLFFVKMFNSDKGIRKIHRKNSCYAFIFCLLHIPLIILMLISLITKKNNFNNDEEKNYFKIFIHFTTLITCSIPLIINIVRQLQGLTRIDCINDCLQKRKKRKYFSVKNVNTYRISNVKDEISFSSEPFEWLENHIIEYYMRDILLGVAVSLQKSKKYEVYSNEKVTLTEENYKEFEKYKIDFDNIDNYELNDIIVKNSEYLNIRVIDYAPKCFAYLRQLEKINIDKMIKSFLPMNNKQGIKKSPGKSGSFFISTDDNKYMIKTLKSDELELLKHTFLQKYINHIKKNPNSLLCRLYGMYNIILGQGDEILIIVMRNVIGDFKDNTIVKFDLKGSTYKRKANFDINDNNNVMKDLDFNSFEKGIMLSLSSIEKLREVIKNDSNFLCKSELMDYSLFLVKLTLSKKEAEDTFGVKIKEKQDNDFIEIIKTDENDIKKNRGGSTTYRGEGKLHDVAHYKQYLFPSLTQGTAYIIAIIDYFQIFNFFKLVESGLKTGFFQKKKKNIISCVDPKTYSERFINYINKLTDVKQFIFNDLIEINNEDHKNKDDSDDDSDSDGIFRKKEKDALSLVNKQINKELSFPFEDKPDIQSVSLKNRIDLE